MKQKCEEFEQSTVIQPGSWDVVWQERLYQAVINVTEKKDEMTQGLKIKFEQQKRITVVIAI